MPAPRRAQLGPVIALSTVTALWGSTFFLSKDLLARLDPPDLLAVRFALATAVLIVIRPTALIGLPRRTWFAGLVLGAIYGLAQYPQYFGLRETTASASGFLIGTYVVFTPLLGLLILRARSPRLTYLGVLLATAGLAVLSFDEVGLGVGELLSLCSAALYGGHIVAMGRWSKGGDAWALTTIQMIAITGTLIVPAAADGLELPATAGDWVTIAYLGLVAGALAIGIQTWAQSRISATHAAVIMAVEPLWAAGMAVAFTAETLSIRLVLGGALLLAANLLIAVTQTPSGAAGRNRSSALPDPDAAPTTVGPAEPR